jgi:hypothetical protein
MKKVDGIKKDLLEKFKPEKEEVYNQWDWLQIRMFWVEKNWEKVDIDIFINRRPEINNIEAHDSIKMKLDYIKEKYWEEKYKEVIANIRYAKQYFKNIWVYKKWFNWQWWLGGIWIETWILQNWWSFDKALETMKKAMQESSNFDEFIDNYLILWAWDNIKEWWMENFTYNMTEEWYNKIKSSLN